MKIILIIVLAISTAIFATLFFIEKAKHNLAEQINTPSIEEFLKINNTSPINDADAKTFRDFFKTEINDRIGGRIPFGVWVDKKAFIDEFNKNDVDGFHIYPICYSRKRTVDGTTFNRGDIGFMFALTQGTGKTSHKDKLSFDYNQPCPATGCP